MSEVAPTKRVSTPQLAGLALLCGGLTAAVLALGGVGRDEEPTARARTGLVAYIDSLDGRDLVDAFDGDLDSPSDDAVLVPAPVRGRSGSAWRGVESLQPHVGLLEKHFGDALSDVDHHVSLKPALTNAASVPARVSSSGVFAHLLSVGRGDAASPIVLAIDGHNRLLWKKERPLAGMFEGIRQLWMTEGPLGGVALFFHAQGGNALGSRMWDGQGGIIADHHLFDLEICTDLHALRFRDRDDLGWVAAVVTGGEVRAQRLSAEGSLVWGERGRALGTGVLKDGAVRLVQLSRHLLGEPLIAVLQLGRGRHGPSTSRRYLYMSIYDAHGEERVAPDELATLPVALALGAEPIETEVTATGSLVVRVRGADDSVLVDVERGAPL